MSMADAIAIARRTLAEYYNLYLLDNKMHGRDHESDKAAAAYNRLAEFDLGMMGGIK